MTTRTSKADKNLYSISKNIVELYAGTDRAQTIQQLPPGTVIDSKVLDDTSEPWDAILKICDGTTGVTFTNLRARQGMENVIDLNNGAKQISIEGSFGTAGESGDQVITIKGGCSDVTIKGIINSTGRNADCVLGQWSDQSTALSTNLDLSGLSRADGKPVTFVLIRFNSVKRPAGSKVLWWPSLYTTAYWYAKWIYVKALKLIGR